MTALATQLALQFEMRTGRQRLIGLSLFGSAFLACLLALVAFSSDAIAPNGWLPYLGSTALFIAACYALFPYKKAEAQLAPLTRQVITIGVLVLSLAAAMRLYRLNDLPFGVWNDETYIATIAKNILADPNYRPFFIVSYDHPLHFYALVALSFRILGVSAESIRIVTTAFGLVSVGLAFMAGRETFGNRFGLILAFLFAISRWHVTFSRFGVYTISLPFFELLTIWLLLRARRTGQLHDFAWAGLALGYGLNFYIAVRLFVGVVFIYIIYWLVTAFWRRLAEELPQSKTALLGGLVAFVLAALLAAAPLIQYALTNSDQYWGRANQVSIFAQYDRADWPKALYLNTVKHLLMFNLEGDHNGRHNLPGEPMLDPIMGVLFVLGLALAVSRVNLPINLLMLALFGINLLGGILTLDFEAPQSNRAFGAIVAVLYFAALSVETLLRSLDQTRPPTGLRRTVLALAALGFGGYIVFYNAHAFFVKQANNDRVWQEYNGSQSLTAKRMLEAYSQGMRIYASVFLNDHEAIRFLAPEITDSQMIVPPVGLPIRETSDKPIAIFVDPFSTWIVDQAKMYYPDAEYRVEYSPQHNPALYTVIIPPEDIQRLLGVTVSYWLGDTPQGAPAVIRDEPSISTHWPAEAPVAAPFVAQWDSTLYAPRYGAYELILITPGAGTVWIDEQQIMAGSGEQHTSLTLAEGDHVLRVQATNGNGPVNLEWRQPDTSGATAGDTAPIPQTSFYLPSKVPVRGLLGTYYNGEDTTDPPAFSRIDSFLDMYFHIIPLARPFTVDWTGQINIPTDGEWAFGLRINGKAEVFIDEQPVLTALEPTEYVEGNKISLAAGWHRIRVHYVDFLGGSRIHLSWVAPGGSPQIVPTDALLPYP